jgi:hypothetical protein
MNQPLWQTLRKSAYTSIIAIKQSRKLCRYEVLGASSYLQKVTALKVLTVRVDMAAALSVHVKNVLIWISELVRGFPRFLQANAGIVPLQGQNRFLPNRFQFLCQLTIQHYIVEVPTAIWNNPQNGNKGSCQRSFWKSVLPGSIEVVSKLVLGVFVTFGIQMPEHRVINISPCLTINFQSSIKFLNKAEHKAQFFQWENRKRHFLQNWICYWTASVV